ncbi:7-cyano-7-deazaguanine synthase [Vibrio algarum]|uniref:7-cyano-7-deazaguanine synthase n=1 Tax=Vibrio algarum TaxID=3020714 RepID=A0ABT4YUJ8_9VIBR|nr:7-cyano-7-deazaguanine synthase [Vibrio sp. KJ40-1]MDB1124694.1 7-cyano-7-deazaguanine synthase [Vibrio sp. KJ40-1]
MSVVSLLSGGLDSCLMAQLIKESGVNQIAFFVNYGQLNYEREYNSARLHANKIGIAVPNKLDISGYGNLITSGLTTSEKHIVDDAFLPGRNLLLLLSASSFAIQNGCDTVAMGLLREDTAIFPDQTDDFLISAENTINKCLGKRIKILTPLREFYKKDVVTLAKKKGIQTYYSCHKGDETPCGKCISCKEFVY